MTTEEKAKAYDKAIEKIKYVMEHGVSPVLNKEDLQDIFPELAESEDERTRKSLILYLENKRKAQEEAKYYQGVEGFERWINWIEKQGKPKLAESEDERIRKEIFHFVLENTLSTDMRQHRWLAWLEKQGEKPKWSEEDEIGSDATIELLEYFINYAPEFRRPTIRRSIDWLKSLKKRMEE